MSARRAPVLVVAGEASGDRLAAGIARRLAEDGIACFGMGGAASERAGVALAADLRETTAMGASGVVARLPAIARAFWAVRRAAKERRPRAAALVDYTEFNLRLGVRLRRDGVRVLWCVAPQIWAWRASRGPGFRRALDRMAVILPFEEALWRGLGVDARYVGHPALDAPLLSRVDARLRLGLPPDAQAIAILPGSRPHVVARMLAPMLGAFERLRRDRRGVDGRLLAAASLDARSRAALEVAGRLAGVRVVDVDPVVGATPILPAFDAALATSGTATLECALAGASPVVAYRTGALTAAVAKRLVRTPFLALPNVVLGEMRYPELVQREVDPAPLARALAAVLDGVAGAGSGADEVRRALAPEGASSTGAAARMADMLRPWLARAGRHR